MEGLVQKTEKTAKFTVATTDRPGLHNLVEFNEGVARREIKATGKVTNASVECCGTAIQFGKESKKYVALPASKECDKCGTIYGINQMNSAKLELRGYTG